jgi:hypothetical protein
MSELFYYNKLGFPIHSIKVIGEITNGMMVQKDGYWHYSFQGSEGSYKYKFLVNDKLELNDPMAYDYVMDGQNSWSLLFVDKKGNRIIQNTPSMIKLKEYCLCSSINQDRNFFSKKIFNTSIFDKAVSRLVFSKARGMHLITAAWYNPYEELYEYSEN